MSTVPILQPLRVQPTILLPAPQHPETWHSPIAALLNRRRQAKARGGEGVGRQKKAKYYDGSFTNSYFFPTQKYTSLETLFNRTDTSQVLCRGTGRQAQGKSLQTDVFILNVLEFCTDR